MSRNYDEILEVDSNPESVILMTNCYKVARYSPDPSTQNSAMLFHLVKRKLETRKSPYNDIFCTTMIYATNEFPENVKYEEERWERPLKYKFIEHAERNAIYKAALVGFQTSGCRMVSPFAACADCARAIIQANIVELVVHVDACERSPKYWSDEIEIADQMLKEAGVKLTGVKGKIGCNSIMHCGEIFHP